MRKLKLLLHTSLDGFLAGPQGQMDWIKVNDELFAYVEQQVASSDAVIYGRNTFGMMESYWPTAGDAPGASAHDKSHSAWYKKVQKYVVSNTMKQSESPNAIVINGDVAVAIRKIKEAAGKDIIVIGSPTLSNYLIQNDLVDEYWLNVNPVILGEGMSLYKNISSKKSLVLAGTRNFDAGVIGLQYQAVKS